ncbi:MULTISPECIES: LysR substrate-binding domain-containing protein [Pseudomonas]|uniref:LysR substrate-binding domain-containing protein n=1 Tax=Pseudomonas TaxID=286 RepID=UPI0006A64A26|nr:MULTISPECIES: LysR substrate-binding domain-containing protein [Pseudomonas]AZD01512.1 Transcriptional regulator, LysR family [Pseudomonas chlororaphis subsp. chlororaphis]MBM0285193.1 LysR family transcriptional regulator [Pseudomonas chlororaphis]MDO1505865.1 LysR family transcriptional regulator [Pseudomonas chlororaphis]ORM49675.1 LysR family transcriptional regulator [Pseudomonas chlororaphis subsp. chlororaphis]TWR98954.1 LysR family transcriptional regulator [Pseudomonas chlororaphis
MQIKWVDDLLAIAECKNFSRAAEIRCVTQSALSRRIRSLEDWVGVELVDRGTYPIQLTLAGQTFCEQGREALSSLLELRSSLRQEERMPGRSIQVTAGHSLSMTFLPKWLARFQQHNEPFNARVVAANIHDAVIALAEGNCDLMIVYHHPKAPILLDHEKFVSLTLGQDSFIPLCAPNRRGEPLHRLPGKAGKPVPHLAYTATTFLGRVADIVIKDSHVPCVLTRCYEADMAMLLMRMAMEGYGVAWLPESAVAEELQHGRLVRAGGSEWSTQLEIRSYCSRANQNPTMLELWKTLEKASQNLAAQG